MIMRPEKNVPDRVYRRMLVLPLLLILGFVAVLAAVIVEALS